MVMHSHWKKPLSAMPSTMIIMPARNTMVSQLMPPLSEASALYQKEPWKKHSRFRVSHTAETLRMQTPKTSSSVAAAQTRVTRWRGAFSVMMKPNMMRKMIVARIWAAMGPPSFSWEIVRQGVSLTPQAILTAFPRKHNVQTRQKNPFPREEPVNEKFFTSWN